MNTDELAESSRLMLQASELFSEATTFASNSDAGDALLAPLLGKIEAAFDAIKARQLVSAGKSLDEAKSLFAELATKMPHQAKRGCQ